jgi:hypothetical protein
MTRGLTAALVLAATIAMPLHAGGFADVARAIDAQRGVNRVWIPFLGVARVLVRVVEPKGVNDFQLAVFEGGDNLDPQQLHQVMRDRIGTDYKPLVQTWSRKHGKREWAFIYAKPVAPNRIELVILAHDDDDTTLVRVDVNADVLARELDNPRGVIHMAKR